MAKGAIAKVNVAHKIAEAFGSDFVGGRLDTGEHSGDPQCPDPSAA